MRLVVLLAVVLVLTVAVSGQQPSSAGAEPNFSGRWRYSNDKAERGPQAVVMEIRQDGVQLTVRERQQYESGERVGERIIYTDGRAMEDRSVEERPRVNATDPKEMRPKTVTSKARWKGGKLQIDAKVFYTPQDFHFVTEVWSLSRDGQALSIKKTYSVNLSVLAETTMVLARVGDADGDLTLKSRKAPGTNP